MKQKYVVIFMVVSVAFSPAALGKVNIATVPVGNPGNAGEWSGFAAGGNSPDVFVGGVDYVYRIGKFEVTAGEYTEFLNAVAAADTYGLYDEQMWSELEGCKILCAGVSGSYAYSVSPDWADRPVNYVSWGDSARFCNWLHNGQPTGAQGLATTEDGSYFVNGAMTEPALLQVDREDDATWVLPSEDEWYKAAYHKNDGVTGNYFDYPTSSDVMPSNDLVAPDPGNNATFYDDAYTIDAPYYRTEVGAHENSASPYGAYDMGGNVFEWNETDHYGEWTGNGIRGAAFSPFNIPAYLHAANHGYGNSHVGYPHVGLRVAQIPEPATAGMLAVGAAALLRRRRRYDCDRKGTG